MKWTMQSLLEIPTYLAGSYLLARFGGLKLLRLSSVMLTLQFVLFAWAGSPSVIIGASALQLFSTPIILIASKTLILEIAPEKLKNSSQLIALSIFSGVSPLVIPVAAGYLSEQTGFNLTLCGVAGLGVLSFLLIWRFGRLASGAGRV